MHLEAGSHSDMCRSFFPSHSVDYLISLIPSPIEVVRFESVLSLLRKGVEFLQLLPHRSGLHIRDPELQGRFNPQCS